MGRVGEQAEDRVAMSKYLALLAFGQELGEAFSATLDTKTGFSNNNCSGLTNLNFLKNLPDQAKWGKAINEIIVSPVYCKCING